MGGTTDAVLLTDDERRAKLKTLLAHRHRTGTGLQLPRTQDYNGLADDKGLATLAYEMCRWLGIKPNGLKVQFTSTTEPAFAVDSSKKLVSISALYKEHPYSTAALVALAITQYFIEHYDHAVPDQAFVEFSTIETGLGLWILNALKPSISHRQSIYHLIDTSWFHVEGLTLTQYQPKQYATAVIDYAHEYRIPEEDYVPRILKRCRYLLPDFITDKTNLYLPEANAVIGHKKAANLLWTKIILIVLILASGISLGFYATASIEEPLDSAKQSQVDTIAILKASYDTCTQKASAQQSKYDPNDLFMTRQVDATKSRCESLRNEYNAAIDQYDKLYTN